jgi:hypothetical protein
VIKSRYGEIRYIKRISNKEYLVYGDSHFVRCGYADDTKNEYEFVDFSGGPFLQVGSKFFMDPPYKEDRQIVKITPGQYGDEPSQPAVLVEVE